MKQGLTLTLGMTSYGAKKYTVICNYFLFICRFSNVVLDQYVKFFADVAKSFDLARLSLQQVQVGSVLRRVFALLPRDRQEALMRKCSLSDNKNANVWYFVGTNFDVVFTSSLSWDGGSVCKGYPCLHC